MSITSDQWLLLSPYLDEALALSEDELAPWLASIRSESPAIADLLVTMLREHRKHEEFIGPRLLVYAAALEMHPLDTEDRVSDLRRVHNIGYCNITTCCRQVCPASITITENAIIPLKERVVDRYFDPLKRLFSIL